MTPPSNWRVWINSQEEEDPELGALDVETLLAKINDKQIK
jgi:hypothetical protein